MNTLILFYLAGMASVLILNLAIALIKKALGIRTQNQRNEILRVEAEKRASDFEARLRLAELDLASQGVRQEPKARVRVKAL